MKQTLIILALTIATASAHPGHPGHEDWPFDDFVWTAALAVAAALTGGMILLKQRRQRRLDKPIAIGRLH